MRSSQTLGKSWASKFAKRNILRHVTVKLARIKYKERILKGDRGEKIAGGLWEFPLHVTDFSAETLQDRMEWHTQSVERKEKKLASQETLCGKVIFCIWRKNKDFPRETKAEGVNHHYTWCDMKEMLKSGLQAEKKAAQWHGNIQKYKTHW